MNNISFQGRTNLYLKIPNYNEVSNNTKNVYRHLTMKNKTIISNGKTYTTSIPADTMAVIVRNEKEGFLKLIPVNSKIENIINEIATKTDDLFNKSKEKLTAWIIGGTPINSKTGEKTTRNLNELAEVLCDRPDIDTSILVGSKNREEEVILHPLENLLEIMLENPKNNSLENMFDIIELNNVNVI